MKENIVSRCIFIFVFYDSAVVLSSGDNSKVSPEMPFFLSFFVSESEKIQNLIISPKYGNLRKFSSDQEIIQSKGWCQIASIRFGNL